MDDFYLNDEIGSEVVNLATAAGDLMNGKSLRVAIDAIFVVLAMVAAHVDQENMDEFGVYIRKQVDNVLGVRDIPKHTLMN